MAESIDEEIRIFEIVFPNNTNSQDNLFGGHALSLMDRLAFIIGSRYAAHERRDRIVRQGRVPHGR